MLEIVRKTNDWLKDYVGKTYSEQLQAKLVRGLFEEHSKKAGGQRMASNYLSERMGKKCVVYCLDPKTMEILDLGGSNLLFDIKTGKYEDNLILDNFGNWFSTVMGLGTTTLNDDGGSGVTVSTYISNQFDSPGSTCQGKMGSGTTAPSRGDFKIQTALGASPESTYIGTTGQGYTIGNQIVYNIDASPTGGSGTVNEAGTFGIWSRQNVSVVIHNFMLTHDSVGPIAYTAGHLLRAAYSWQI